MNLFEAWRMGISSLKVVILVVSLVGIISSSKMKSLKRKEIPGSRGWKRRDRKGGKGHENSRKGEGVGRYVSG